MGDEYASEYIIRHKQTVLWKSIIKARCNSAVIFLWDITEKKTKKTQLSYWGMAYIHAIWYIYESVYLSNCVFVNVSGEWIFDSNLKVALPLTQYSLNCICHGNDTYENKFIGVLHAIRPFPPEVVQRILNMK